MIVDLHCTSTAGIRESLQLSGNGKYGAYNQQGGYTVPLQFCDERHGEKRGFDFYEGFGHTVEVPVAAFVLHHNGRPHNFYKPSMGVVGIITLSVKCFQLCLQRVVFGSIKRDTRPQNSSNLQNTPRVSFHHSTLYTNVINRFFISPGLSNRRKSPHRKP